MSCLGNFLWFVFGGGFLFGLHWVFIGCLCFISIIGIPFGIACFRIASFAFFPFGKKLVPAEMGEAATVGTICLNVVWCIFFGLWLAIGHILCGISCCCTIIGIPFGLAHFKLAKVCFAPFGKEVVSSE